MKKVDGTTSDASQAALRLRELSRRLAAKESPELRQKALAIRRFASQLESWGPEISEALGQQARLTPAWPSPEKIAGLRKHYPKAYGPWTASEESKLRELFNEGLKPEEIALQLGRKPNAIRHRLKRLHLPISLQFLKNEKSEDAPVFVVPNFPEKQNGKKKAQAAE